MVVSIPGGKPLHEPPAYIRRCLSLLPQCFNPRREAPPRATHYRCKTEYAIARFNPRREAPPRATSKLWYHCYELLIVSIPGGKPLHEPPTSVAFGQYYQSCVSIPGGKPLDEPPSAPVLSP